MVLSRTKFFTKKITIYRDGQLDGTISVSNLSADYVHHSFHIFVNIYQPTNPYVEIKSNVGYLDLCAILSIVIYSFIFDVSQLNW